MNYISPMVNITNYELTLGQYNADVDYSEFKCKFAYFKRSVFFQEKGFCIVLILVGWFLLSVVLNFYFSGAYHV